MDEAQTQKILFILPRFAITKYFGYTLSEGCQGQLTNLKIVLNFIFPNFPRLLDGWICLKISGNIPYNPYILN